MADRALIDTPGRALPVNGLQVIGVSGRWSDGMRTAVTGGAMHALMANRILVERVCLFEFKPNSFMAI